MSALFDKVSPLKDEFVTIRHDIHAHPEVGFQEKRTSDIVASKLESWGYTLERGIGGTGMVATLRTGTSKKIIGLRAEMDALPMCETGTVPWKSVNDGVAHMCGHDGHTTMLLCAAKYLAQTRHFDGTLHLIFQPAEEPLTGGSRMIADGLFEKYPCDVLFAMHNMPGYPTGNVFFHKNAALASSDIFKITITGKGGHGAMPQLARDPIVTCAHLVLALQTIVSRNVDPFVPAVITVGALQAGTAPNIIPSTGELQITVRSVDEKTHQFVLERLKDITNHVAETYGCTATIDHVNGNPVLVNDPKAVDFAFEVATEVLGKDKCHTGPAFMASDDFAHMLQAHPNGCYWFIGNGTEGCNAIPVHNGGFDFNDDNIVPGATLFVGLVEKYLQAQN